MGALLNLMATKNWAEAALASGIGSTDTVITLVSGGGANFSLAPSQGAFEAVIWNFRDYPDPFADPNREIVWVTNTSGDSFTVTRGVSGTTAVAHNTPDKIYHLGQFLTSKMFDDIDSNFTTIGAHLSNTSNPHNTTASQVGLANVTNDAQLKQASNLSDLANAATARTNLGLGDSATKNVGQTSGTVTAGDDNRLPIAGEKSALAGTSGTPSSTNKYVTNADTRLSDSRTPNAHASTHSSGGSDAITVSNLAGTITDSQHGSKTTDTLHALATASNHGFLSKTDYSKLSGIASGAEVNQNAFGNIKYSTTTLTAAAEQDTIEFVAGTDITLSLNTGTKQLTIGLSSTANADKLDSYHAGNATGQIPISNGTLNTNLNSDMLEGYHAGNSTGQIPISNGTVNTNLNAEMVGGIKLAGLVQTGDARVTADQATGTASIRTLGTGSTQAAAGDHLHDSRYLQLSGGTLTGYMTVHADPSSAMHVASKQYVDNAILGLTNKKAARVATTANITLSGTQTIDGIAVIAGDRILVKNQTAPAENGIYVVASGAWSRATDADVASEFDGMYVFVKEGTANADSGWFVQTDGAITLGTTGITFVEFTGANRISVNAPLSKSGNVISHNDSGVTASTYRSVTVDAKGHVTGGTNPTTLAGYAISDAVNSSDVVTSATANKILKLDGNSKLPASITGDAATVGGLSVGTVANSGVNQIVRTDGNGYIQSSYLYTTSGDNTTTTITRVYASHDQYIRFYTLANFASQVLAQGSTKNSHNHDDLYVPLTKFQFPASVTTDLRTVNQEGIYFSEALGGSTNQPLTSTAGGFFQVADATGTDIKFQMWGKSDGAELYYQIQWGNGSWKGWKRLWNDGNFDPSTKANLASPTFTGTPAAPTAAVDTNTTQIATTAFVIGQGYQKVNNYLSGVSGSGNGTVTFTRSGLTNLTWDASHTHAQYLTAEADTLDTVLGRGNSSTRSATVAGLTSTAEVTAAGASGFYSATYVSNARNPIWRFKNSDTYGISYFQGSAGYSGTSTDSIGFHFGTATAAGSAFTISADGVARVGSNTVIHSGNIGSQSVSNADTLDSLHSGSFFRTDTTNGDARFAGTEGTGVKLYDSNNASIQMSGQGNATYGGRLDSTSDYNMYFTMGGGTNRGFAFRSANNSSSVMAQIDSSGNFYLRGGIIICNSSGTPKFKIVYNSTEDSLDTIKL